MRAGSTEAYRTGDGKLMLSFLGGVNKGKDHY